MKKIAAFAVLTAGAVALPSLAVADEGGAFRVRGGLAVVNYVNPGTGGTDFESTYSAATLGGSYVASSGWFFDLGLRQSLAAEWNAKDFGFTEDGDFDRQETTLSVGKALGNGFSVFGGVQLAKNEFENSEPGFSMKVETDSTLLFVGGSKAFQAGKGALSLSAALGLMKQEQDANITILGVTGTGSAKSDSGFGFSLGAGYSLPLSGKLSLQGDLRYQQYSVEYQGSSSDENVASLGVALVAQF